MLVVESLIISSRLVPSYSFNVVEFRSFNRTCARLLYSTVKPLGRCALEPIGRILVRSIYCPVATSTSYSSFRLQRSKAKEVLARSFVLSNRSPFQKPLLVRHVFHQEAQLRRLVNLAKSCYCHVAILAGLTICRDWASWSKAFVLVKGSVLVVPPVVS